MGAEKLRIFKVSMGDSLPTELKFDRNETDCYLVPILMLHIPE